MSKIYQNDFGTVFKVNVGKNIVGATKVQLLVKKPNASSFTTWVGSVLDRTYIKYVIKRGDLDLVGIYTLQAYVELPAWSGRGDTTTFEVYAPFK